MLYLDHNATTLMAMETKLEMVKWCSRGNASASYAAASECSAMMREFAQALKRRLHASDYKVIFTSGASEANCSAFRHFVERAIDSGARGDSRIHNGKYAGKRTGTRTDALNMVLNGMRRGASTDSMGSAKPHVVISACEHKSMLMIADSYHERGLIELTRAGAMKSGHTHPKSILDSLRGSTALVAVMHSNNETGAINDIAGVAQVCKRADVPLLVDCVQSFCKVEIDLDALGVDAATLSFHKIGGPPGVGALLLHKKHVEHFLPTIFGAQNDSMRGGTENVPGLAASYHALRLSRAGEFAATLALKRRIKLGIARKLPTMQYTEYTERGAREALSIVFLSNFNEYYLPNTILLSVVSGDVRFCNTKLKEYLATKHIVVSIGSACNTSDPRASHVLYAMGADEYIRRGAIRVSLGSEITSDDCDVFVREFLRGVEAQL
jgi:cysteine desulfurase